MAFWKTDKTGNSFDDNEFPIDRSVDQQTTGSLSFIIRDSGSMTHPDYSKVTMNNKGELHVSCYAIGEVCRNKKELKKFISWLIIAYKNFFND